MSREAWAPRRNLGHGRELFWWGTGEESSLVREAGIEVEHGGMDGGGMFSLEQTLQLAGQRVVGLKAACERAPQLHEAGGYNVGALLGS
ncbi:hypothetical protein CYMTET_50617 [Cymbomonas tetramitiformis]|uniref:Uncharacterized protein n=1 Tax=Cymbomonas tetramitiformis TaxID=36881 RepID=A0AAE0BPQ8_9CHLO|nr:hypothetical protein CYMTET_50617 [Cymbomonas tetramitiformis]